MLATIYHVVHMHMHINSSTRRGCSTVRVKRSKLRNTRYFTPIHSHMPPRWFWGKRGGCFADFYAQNPILGHIGVSKLIISGLLALPSYRVITHQNCSLSRPTPPSVFASLANSFQKDNLCKSIPPESYLVPK